MDYVTGAISKSRASIETWASEEFASATIESKVESVYGDFYSNITITGNGIEISHGSNGCYIRSTAFSLYGNVTFPDGFRFGSSGKKVKTVWITDKYDDEVQVLSV